MKLLYKTTDVLLLLVAAVLCSLAMIGGSRAGFISPLVSPIKALLN